MSGKYVKIKGGKLCIFVCAQACTCRKTPQKQPFFICLLQYNGTHPPMHLYKDNSYHCILICIIVASSPHLAICAWKHFYPVGKKTKQVNTQNLISFMKNALWLVFFYTIVHMLVCWPLQNHSELLCKLSASYHPQTANN